MTSADPPPHSACPRPEQQPQRTVIQAEALGWLAEHPAESGSSVITSLPDVSELGGRTLAEWRHWFVDAARQVIRWVPPGGVSIFFQSDIRQGGIWIDKGYLVSLAAEEAGAHLLWHRIVCRKPPGTPSWGRASYSHLLCFSTEPRPLPKHPYPDVLPDAGFMPWSRAMGVLACELACQFLLEETTTQQVVDPFCGVGTALAVANARGLNALGVDLSRRRCRAAQRLELILDQPR